MQTIHIVDTVIIDDRLIDIKPIIYDIAYYTMQTRHSVDTVIIVDRLIDIKSIIYMGLQIVARTRQPRARPRVAARRRGHGLHRVLVRCSLRVRAIAVLHASTSATACVFRKFTPA